MHPDKFLGRAVTPANPTLSDSERDERLNDLCWLISSKRKEAVTYRKTSGIEDMWLACEENYLGVDDLNRDTFAKAKWAKPLSINGPLTSQSRRGSNDLRSKAFVRLTSRYVDFGVAKLCEIILPIDDKAFSFDGTPEPDLIKQQSDLMKVVGQGSTQPAAEMQPVQPPMAPPPWFTAELPVSVELFNVLRHAPPP